MPQFSNFIPHPARLRPPFLLREFSRPRNRLQLDYTALHSFEGSSFLSSTLQPHSHQLFASKFNSTLHSPRKIQCSMKFCQIKQIQSQKPEVKNPEKKSPPKSFYKLFLHYSVLFSIFRNSFCDLAVLQSIAQPPTLFYTILHDFTEFYWFLLPIDQHPQPPEDFCTLPQIFRCLCLTNINKHNFHGLLHTFTTNFCSLQIFTASYNNYSNFLQSFNKFYESFTELTEFYAISIAFLNHLHVW